MSHLVPLLAIAGGNVWYIIPLAAAISLVYSASRYELAERVIHRAIRLFAQITGFMACVLVALWLLSYNL
ncbi:MAG: hypothetical protein ACYTGL_19635 [Planctomycetota bacterium]|jgi:hypothetical protein